MRGEAVSLDIKSIRSLQRRSPSEQSWDRYVREVIPKRRTTQSRYQSWIKNHTRSVPDRFRMESNRLVPSRDICEQCHWLAKFDAVKLRVILHFQDDAANTQTQTALMMLTGCGDLGGIHGKHMGAAAGSQAWGQRASISSSTTSSHPPPVRRWKHLWFAPAARGDTTIETGAPVLWKRTFEIDQDGPMRSRARVERIKRSRPF